MIEIRPLAATDEAVWRVLWRDYLTFYRTHLPEEVFRSTFARLTDPNDDDIHGLLAEADGEAVGLVHYIFHRHGWRIEKVCYLQDLFVSDTARGLGAGRALIEGVYRAADERGCPSVYWMTHETNAVARSLYDRIGNATGFIKYAR